MSRFTEDTTVDRIEAQWLPAATATEDSPAIPARWVVSVRRSDRVLRDGVVISATPHRHVIERDDPLTGEDRVVAALPQDMRR